MSCAKDRACPHCRTLQSAGIIDNDLIFRAGAQYVYGVGSSLKPGEYAFEPQFSMYEVMDTLRSGRGVVHKVSLPEGPTVKQIFDKLAADEVLVGPLPEEIPVEGILMPDTYPFQRGTTRDEIVEQMMRAQQRHDQRHLVEARPRPADQGPS